MQTNEPLILDYSLFTSFPWKENPSIVSPSLRNPLRNLTRLSAILFFIVFMVVMKLGEPLILIFILNNNRGVGSIGTVQQLVTIDRRRQRCKDKNVKTKM